MAGLGSLCAQRLYRVRRGQQRGRVNERDRAAGVERHGNVVARGALWKFRHGHKVIGAFGEEGIVELAVEHLQRRSNGLHGIDGLLGHGVPRGTGKTDLQQETGHGRLFLGEGRFGVCAVCAREGRLSIQIELEIGNQKGRPKKSFDFRKISLDIK
jgi:hypothetical protein